MTVRLNGATSGYVELDSPAVGGNNNIKLPGSNGSANQFLKNTGTAGTLGWSSLVEDSSGRVLVGTSTAQGVYRLQLQGSSADASGSGSIFLRRGLANASISTGNGLGNIDFGNQDGGVGARIEAEGDAQWGTNDYPGRLVFSLTADGASSLTPRHRISSSGATNLFVTSADGFNCRVSVGAGTATHIFAGVHSATDLDSGTVSFRVWSNGNVINTNNSYTGISDIKLKENIVDAGSQWGDLKALQVRKYNFKKDTGHETHTQIGLIAQEAELVSPGLVFESPDRDAEGNDLGTVTKSVNYSVLYMKAVKALQEAMERIETLESANASLEARLTALEAAS